jgi:hypothetical protein
LSLLKLRGSLRLRCVGRWLFLQRFKSRDPCGDLISPHLELRVKGANNGNKSIYAARRT